MRKTLSRETLYMIQKHCDHVQRFTGKRLPCCEENGIGECSNDPKLTTAVYEAESMHGMIGFFYFFYTACTFSIAIFAEAKAMLLSVNMPVITKVLSFKIII